MHRPLAYAGLILAVVGPLGAFLRVLPPIAGFGSFALAGAVGLMAVVWGAVAAARRRGGRGPRAALISAALGAVPLIATAALLLGGVGHPRINDITTDLGNPPALAGGEPYPQEFAPLVREGYPDLAGLVLETKPGEAFARAVELARSRPGWTLGRVDEQAMVIEGVAETRVFRFRDDFAIRIGPRGDGAVVDMRSRSREGKGDLGANAARIQAFLVDLDRSLRAPAR